MLYKAIFLLIAVVKTPVFGACTIRIYRKDGKEAVLAEVGNYRSKESQSTSWSVRDPGVYYLYLHRQLKVEDNNLLVPQMDIEAAEFGERHWVRRDRKGGRRSEGATG